MGYVYALSNESMPGLIKIGMTERTPEERLAEANLPDTFKPPLPYVIEIQKKVNNCKETEKKIHALLSDKRVNPHREFFKITIEELKVIFNAIEDNQIDQTDIVLEKEKDFICKVNNNIFELLFNFKINNIYFNKCFIKINHEKKEYEYNGYSSNNLVHIINIVLSIESHIFGDDTLEYYALYYIKKSEGKIVRYPHLKEHFRNWAKGNIGNVLYSKHNFIKLFYAYISKNYICNTDNVFDIEIMDNDNTPHYKINYNIIEHYPEDLKTLYQLIKQCHVVIGKTKIPLHKYMESKKIET
jgi:hypothetical protein